MYKFLENLEYGEDPKDPITALGGFSRKMDI